MALQGTTFANKDSIKIRVMTPRPSKTRCVPWIQPPQFAFLCSRGVERCLSLDTDCWSAGQSSKHTTRQRPSWTIREVPTGLAPAASSESGYPPRSVHPSRRGEGKHKLRQILYDHWAGRNICYLHTIHNLRMFFRIYFVAQKLHVL